MKYAIRCWALLFWFALPGTAAWGQNGNATLTGTVADTSGGVIPGAQVTITNVATGVAKVLATTDTGLYFSPSLIPGVYRIEVKAAGFGTREIRGIRLVIDQQARVDMQLEVATAQQQVTVTGEALPLLQTSDPSVGFVVQAQQVHDLPLNGRYFTQLLQLSPGTNDNGEQRNGMPLFDVNGQEGNSTFFRMDGVENNERQFGGASIPVSVDAIQEVKLQTSNFSAEYGRSPAQVDVVVKSGTNRLHGALFEFLRNEKLDAPQWAYTGPHNKNQLKRNQFGVSLGGPVKRDKLFYFFNYDGTREIFSSPQLLSVPSNDMLNGVFPSGVVIFDPLTQKPFANNTIPKERFNPIAAKVKAYMPAPNLPGLTNRNAAGFYLAPSQNYFYDPQRRQTINQYNIRLDYNRSATDTYFVRYTNSSNDRVGEGPMATNIQNAVNGFEIAKLGGQNVSAAWYHNLSPYTINELRGGTSTNPQEYLKGDNTDYAAEFGLKQFLAPNAYPGFPHFNIGGIHLGSGDYRPLKVGDVNFQVHDAMTLVRGNHTLKIGGDVRRTLLATLNNDLSTGKFYFNGAQTRDRATPNAATTFCPGVTSGTRQCSAGNATADFLLGYMASADIGSPIPRIDKRFSNWAGYINDTWFVTRRLTLTLGLRYEYQTRFHANPQFISEPIIKNGEFSGQVAVGNDSSGKMSSAVQPEALAQIPGAAVTCRSQGLPDNCLISHKTAWQPRLGIAYRIANKTVVRTGAGIFYGSFYGDADTESCQYWPLVSVLGTLIYTSAPSGAAPPPLSLSNPFAGATGVKPTFVNCAPPDRKLPSSYQWNFTVERNLGSRTTVSAGYVGNTTRHLDHRYRSAYNIPQPWGVVLAPGQSQQVAVPAFSAIELYDSQDTSSYNSLQTKVERRLSHGFYLSTAYTWAKNLEYRNWLTDPRNPKLDRGPSPRDLRHVLVVSPIYQIPVGKGQRLASKSALLDKIAGGWQVSGIISYRTGFPFTPTISGVDLLRLNGYNEQNRPDRICSGKLSRPSFNQWFDPACFTVPVQPTTPGALLRGGSSGYNILRGPHGFGTDLGVAKSFRITERYALDFRTEMFNALNHPVMGLPASGLNLVATATPQTRITSVVSKPRIIQFAMKVRF